MTARLVDWSGHDDEGNTVTGTVTVDVAVPTAGLRWSDTYPDVYDTPLTISNRMILDRDVTINGKLTVSGALIADPAGKHTLRVAGSLVVTGLLEAQCPDPTTGITVRIIGGREADMLGAPTGTPDTDRGVWVQQGGRLNLAGAPRTRWTFLTAAAARGDTTIWVQDAGGWQVGDELLVCPTEPITVPTWWDRYDRPRIVSIAGNTVRLDRGLTFPHPFVTDPTNVIHRAEVANLTSNVVIEGDTEANTVGPVLTDGRAFIHMHDGAAPVILTNVAMRHLGPRKRFLDGSKNVSDVILGRYCLHWHRNGESSAGSVVDSCVISDSGSRGYVPHASHGVTITRSVAHSVGDAALWWDLEDPAADATKRLLVEDCLFSRVLADPGGYKDSGLSGVLASWGGLGAERPTMRRCRIVGVQGNGDSAGITWPSQTNGTNAGPGNTTVYNNEWVVEDCASHNNKLRGVQVWHNTTSAHQVLRMTCFHNAIGWKHGAYRNTYRILDVHLFGNGTDLEHRAAGNRSADGSQVQSWAGGWIGRMLIAEHQLPYITPVRFDAVTIGALTVRDNVAGATGAAYEIVGSGLTPAAITVTSIAPDGLTAGQAGTSVKVQTGTQAWHYTAVAPTGETIPLFA